MNIINLRPDITTLRKDNVEYVITYHNLQEKVVNQTDIKVELDSEYPEIRNVSVSCGCTTPSLQKVPNENAQIVSIGLRPGSKGKISKSIKLSFTNGKKIFILLEGEAK